VLYINEIVLRSVGKIDIEYLPIDGEVVWVWIGIGVGIAIGLGSIPFFLWYRKKPKKERKDYTRYIRNYGKAG
jgi:hypothetical protein